ncbi:MAG: FAD-dependent oxidoreductase [Proteobacteria bacterium]|nr:FAD-dependent oxidoreductase [Pseudomonadota bacterium]
MTQKAALVIGGGIAGIQASIDLANMGIKVYLLEKKPSIGGRMAQLDKTFPTNDCSMCILAPKMIECANHENVQLLTYSELSELTGNAGDFRARIVRKARFIDEVKCVGCGECIERCPITVKDEFNAGLGKRKAIYKYFPQSVPSTFAIDRRGTAPCKAACPAHISVQGYVALIAQGRFAEALRLIKEENPLPAICGRVCHHPCESVCTRGQVDEPVAIDFIKRFVADLDLNSETRYLPQIKEQRDQKVAIIGAGPAGLSCAYYLAKEGYPVTIYEKLPVAGGMLSVGIPEYRLPREIIKAEIQIIRDMGVDIRTGVDIGKDITIKDLREEGYKAIFLGIGAHECKGLNIEGEDLEGVYPGVGFLREVNLGGEVSLGDRIAVVGGGNVAMDAVRTARRLGVREPFIIYRRSFEEMPANEEEIEECKEEGIPIHPLTNPTRIIGQNGKVKAIECLKMALGEPDESGRRRPIPIKGSEFIIEVDGVIPAIGQESDWACLGPECACTLSGWGTVNTDPVTLQTDDPDIFAGGDAVTGPRTVIEAIEAGKQAAISMDRFIRGVDLREGRQREWEPVEDVSTEGYAHLPRTRMPRLDPGKRLNNFREVQLGFSQDQAVAEARRCISCGICSECYTCVAACKAEAVDFSQKEREMTVNVGAVVLATGFDLYDVSPLVEYGWGRIENVITAMQFERMICASGPTTGHLKRPSDGKEPRRLGFIQCVGSRDIRHMKYCSAVCCMHATKEAILAREHCPELTSTIFYMDMRAVGKGFQEYVRRAKSQYEVEYIRARPGRVTLNEETRNPVIHYEDTVNREFRAREFDMVILSQALVPSESNISIAKRLGVELDEFGFIAIPEELSNPFGTTKEGVFGCGFCQSPMDVPDSVIRASGAASKVAEILAHA